MTVIPTAQSLREERAVEGHIVISDFLANDMTVIGERQRHQEHGAVRRSIISVYESPCGSRTKAYCFCITNTPHPADNNAISL